MKDEESITKKQTNKTNSKIKTETMKMMTIFNINI